MLNRSNGGGNNIFQVVNMLKSGNPQAIMNQMMQTNPQFAQFVNENKGKSVDQIAKDYNVDLNSIRQFMR
jgi:hypothetical protein